MKSLIEWFANYPIRQVKGLLWRLPDGGMYRGEQVVFQKNAAGKITGVKVGGVLFPRRKVGPADGVTFQIEALFPRIEA